MKEVFHFGDLTAELHLGDCLELLPIEADAVVSDPPYGIAHPCNYAQRGRGKLAACNDWPNVSGDDAPFDPSHWLNYAKVILWGANYFSHLVPPMSGWLVWDKERPDDLDQSTCELAWTNCVKGVRRLSHLWNGMMKASEKGESYHPTQKPVALMEWCLDRAGIPEGDTVLDPFMGSCPVGIACLRTGRNFVGIEKDVTHWKTACERIRRECESPMLPLGRDVRLVEVDLPL